MKSPSVIIKTKREKVGLTSQELADRVGCSKGTISQIENGAKIETKGFAIVLGIAKTLDIELESLVDLSDVRVEATGGRSTYNIKKVPILSYAQAATPSRHIDDYEEGNGMAVILVQGDLASNLSSDGFALEVLGTSMLPEYREGDQVIVDPSADYQPGEIVVAKLESEELATLKKYRPRGRDQEGLVIELVPSNDDHPTQTIDSNNPGFIVGPVVRHIRDPRR